MKRRDFIKICAAAGAGFFGYRWLRGEEENAVNTAAGENQPGFEAYHCAELDNGDVSCEICFRGCRIPPEEVGRIYELQPEEIVQEAHNSGVPSISFTYNEP